MLSDKDKKHFELLQVAWEDLSRHVEPLKTPDNRIDVGIGHFLYNRMQEWNKLIETELKETP